MKLDQYQKDVNMTSFVGVFPVSKPKYIVLAMVEHPKKIKEENYSITGATVAAPLVKEYYFKHDRNFWIYLYLILKKSLKLTQVVNYQNN